MVTFIKSANQSSIKLCLRGFMLNTSWSKRLSHGWGVIDVFVFNVSIFSKENNFHVMYSWNMFVWRRLSCTSSGLHLAFVRLEDKIVSIYYVNSCTIYAVFENSFYFGLNSMDLYIYTSLYWEKNLTTLWHELCLGKGLYFSTEKDHRNG